MRIRPGRLLLAVGGLAAVLWLFEAPTPAEAPYERRHFALGTVVTLRLYPEAGAEADYDSLAGLASAEIDRIGGLMSGYEPSSQISRFNASGPGPATAVDDDTRRVVERSLHWAERSRGAFDPTVGPLSRLWGFPEATAPPAASAIERALDRVGWNGALRAGPEGLRWERAGGALDLGAAAKGYAVDRAVERLVEAGVACGLVEAGGDFRYWGRKPDGGDWTFGVKHPRQRGKLILVEDIGLTAVATSGDYEQFFDHDGRRYHHLLDPRTGYPARRAVSATAWASSAMDADILATALFVMGPDSGLELVEALPGVEALVFYQSGGELRHRASSGLARRLRFD